VNREGRKETGGPAHTRFLHRRGSGAGPNQPDERELLGWLHKERLARATRS